MAAKNTSFSIGAHFADFIEAQIEQERYASASDVVRAGLRLLEEREAHLAALLAAIAAGDESGDSGMTLEEIWNEVKQEARQPALHG